ncbi:MAG: HDOD domain-containing protein [Pirellulales bacterium]|nr:HDOD domain-containing protein [Pirellulales bacterium]
MSNTKQSAIDLKQLLSNAQLPALPQSAISLLELSQNPRNGPAEFAEPIETDPGLTGQVLRFVNSSYFGFSREISSVKLAITLVGTRTIKNFSLWSAVFSLMPNPKCGMLDLKSLWQDSLRRALFARIMAKHIGFKATEEVFAAALLQDMAVPLLAKEASDRYSKLFDERAKSERRLSDIEQDTFGWTHAEAAGMMARQWNLPEDFAVMIESHTEIDCCLDEMSKSNDKSEELGKIIVALSALLPSAADSQWNEFEEFESAYNNIVLKGVPKLAAVLAQTDEEFTEFSPVLKITSPKMSLIDYHDQLTSVAN